MITARLTTEELDKFLWIASFVDDKLPNISIITPTYNRRNMVKLMLLNYNMMNYPIEKREWIIIDDSYEKERVESQLPPKEFREKYGIHYANYVIKKLIS